jgi:hypothetical protein
MLALVLKWLAGGVLKSLVKPVLAVISGLLAYAKGRQDQKMKDKNATMKANLDALERKENVETNTTRDDAIDRLRRNGDLRD